jgi:NRAMP (natural resistance-associated macrophage protein)-like metal ion transporter
MANRGSGKTAPSVDSARRPTRSAPGGRIQAFFRDLGPGLITGAADDDPSGISTYSVCGAAFGYAPLWTALFSFPLMSAVQLMCARLGMVTGRGLAGVVRRRYPASISWIACALLIIANVFNIGADLGGMAEASEMVTGLNRFIWTPLYAVLIVSMLFWSSYRGIARIFKWLTLVLFAYVITAFLAHPDWRMVLNATFIPHIEWSRSYLAVLVGVLGTTISPYLFFWQSSVEVEEERAIGRRSVGARKGATPAELRKSFIDVITGMFFSNFVMYFIILTTAATLHAHGKTSIETARQAAEALRPLAGNGAYLLFTLGLIGTGILAIPVLAGSSAYAVAEALAWKASLDLKPHLARKFYAVMALAMVLGLCLNYIGISAVKMLFWSAVLNGVLAPPLILLVVVLTSDRRTMGDQTNPPFLRWMGWLSALVMAAAALAMFVAQ